MPNLVYCSLIMQGEPKAIEQVKLDICGVDEGSHIRQIDFNKIIPMPPELNITNCETVKELTRHKYIKKTKEQHFEVFLKGEGNDQCQNNLLLAEQYYRNYQNHGAMTWNDWCIKHWGTKWNAIFDDFQEQNKDPHVIHFITANAPPIPVMNTIACRYPDVEFTLEYFEEGNHEDITTVSFIIGEPPQT